MVTARARLFCFSVIWCRSRLIQFAFLLQKTAIFISTPWESTWYLFHANHAPKCTTLECGSDLIAQSRDVAGAEQQPRNGTCNSLADTLTPASWYPPVWYKNPTQPRPTNFEKVLRYISFQQGRRHHREEASSADFAQVDVLV